MQRDEYASRILNRSLVALVIRSLVVLILALAMPAFFVRLDWAASSSPPVTPVSGPIASDTTWTVAASPYHVTSSVTVNAGVTLTIEPGVVVKFGHNTGLYVDGTLLAQGTPAAPIHFTDFRDDTVGGDSNG
ncbi:MAG: hypothetical protein AB1402_07530, partial [Bacillota bacterium]